MELQAGRAAVVWDSVRDRNVDDRARGDDPPATQADDRDLAGDGAAAQYARRLSRRVPGQSALALGDPARVRQLRTLRGRRRHLQGALSADPMDRRDVSW